eukprot:jgi/Botrbrau1/11976/Bobra.0115s0012.1
MSDSDDDKPLGTRVVAKIKPETAKPVVETSSDDEMPILQRAKPKAAGPKKVRDTSSDDDMPINQRANAKTAGSSKAVANGQKPKVTVKASNAAVKETAKRANTKETATPAKERQKREKKVFPNPGQTKETPAEGDSLRKFYESLHRQRPDSMMAKKWLLTVGLLAEDEAQDVLAELGKLKIAGVKSPVKSNGRISREVAPARQERRNPAPVKKGKKRKEDTDISESDVEIMPKKQRKLGSSSDDDFKPVKKKTDPAKKARPAKKDVAFADGGLDDSDSDDDKPLLARVRKL